MPLSARSQHSTLTQFLIEERRKYPGASGDFNALILDIALACKAIARGVAFGELGQVLGDHKDGDEASVNVQGEAQKTLDVLSNRAFIRRTEWAGNLAGMASEEMEHPYQIPAQYPRDTKDPSKAGRLRLLYEANPVGMIMEQAGGRASTGEKAVLDVAPSSLHQRIGLVFGSRNEVERIERYHREPAQTEEHNPLFAERSLFRF